MDYARIILFSIGIITSFYYYWKHKKDIYLLCAIICWLSPIYVGGLNLRRLFPSEIQRKIDLISLFFLLLVFIGTFLELLKKEINDKRKRG
jgi:cbb3-type cytochrome oxidase subunit 3